LTLARAGVRVVGDACFESVEFRLPNLNLTELLASQHEGKHYQELRVAVALLEKPTLLEFTVYQGRGPWVAGFGHFSLLLAEGGLFLILAAKLLLLEFVQAQGSQAVEFDKFNTLTGGQRLEHHLEEALKIRNGARLLLMSEDDADLLLQDEHHVPYEHRRILSQLVYVVVNEQHVLLTGRGAVLLLQFAIEAEAPL